MKGNPVRPAGPVALIVMLGVGAPAVSEARRPPPLSRVPLARLSPSQQYERLTGPMELRPVGQPRIPRGKVNIDSIIRRLFGRASREVYEARAPRTRGPSLRHLPPGGRQPYLARQQYFREKPWRERLSRKDLREVLGGTVLVMRRGDQVDFIARDHHTLDVLLYERAATGYRPDGLFHLDRHTDFDAAELRPPRAMQQYNRWWGELERIRLPGGKPLLRADRVIFATAVPDAAGEARRQTGGQVWGNPGRTLGGPAAAVPRSTARRGTDWRAAIQRAAAQRPGAVSIDVDALMPSCQLALTRGLLKDPRFGQLMDRARLRLFVLSPSFLNGGDLIERAEVNGSISSAQRLINFMRRDRRGAARRMILDVRHEGI